MFQQQIAVEHHVIQGRIAVAQFFEVGANKVVVTPVRRVSQRAVQPGSVHQFAGRHVLQEIQRVGFV
nr:hypothetical protein [Tanacetum cinerariifolium]